MHHQSSTLPTSVNGHSSIAWHMCKLQPLFNERSYSYHMGIMGSKSFWAIFFPRVSQTNQRFARLCSFLVLISANLPWAECVWLEWNFYLLAYNDLSARYCWVTLQKIINGKRDWKIRCSVSTHVTI